MLVLIHTSLSLGRPSPEAALRRLDAERRLVDELRPPEVVLVRRVEPARGVESAFRFIFDNLSRD